MNHLTSVAVGALDVDPRRGDHIISH
jgi:hypothetical protein